MRARIYVFYKDSVFDPQGNTVAGSLKRMGFAKVDDVRMGKVIDVTFQQSSIEEARKDVAKMCDKLLVNPVIESYKVEFLDE